MKPTRSTRASFALLCLLPAAAAVLAATGCGAGIAADAPVVTYYYVPG